ncbi:MAG: hypothetical protein IJN57_01225 [Oscillospiraceae bacterium]|nr:hypothetical protein [Oscillospiraceae bacterium]
MKKEIFKDMELAVDGIGLVIYSDEAMCHVEEGENYFENEFATPEKVAEHIAKGDIVGFCTGTSGNYCIKVREGYPDSKLDEQFPISIRLALNVKGNKISIIDLAWLMEWSPEIPPNQQIYVEEGIYHLTILTRKPSSGMWGDNQIIYIFMNRLHEMPKLGWKGVPQLFTD